MVMVIGEHSSTGRKMVRSSDRDRRGKGLGLGAHRRGGAPVRWWRLNVVDEEVEAK